MDETKIKPRDDCLPLSKIRTIMKSSPDIELVSQESLPIVCRATVSTSARLAYGKTIVEPRSDWDRAFDAC